MFKKYKNKRVFITGHTGFKGSWLSLILSNYGAEVCGYALEPNTNPSMFKSLNIKNQISKSIIGNILDYDLLEKSILDFKPDIIFHLAAQPLVRLSYIKPLLTYQTNVIGSLNVLEAAKKFNCAVINVTTDKCYENKETNRGYLEEDSLGGYDMYSSSKACSEIMTSSYRRSFNLNVATVRAGNVIGGGDWAKDRLIPDCIRSFESNKPIEIRNPKAIRPWQHVVEPLFGYMMLGEKMFESAQFAQAFNFGPEKNNNQKVFDIVNKFVNLYGKGEVNINQSDDLHESKILMLNSNKAKSILNWSVKLDIEKTLEKTAKWYNHFYKKDTNMLEYTLAQIKEYEELWKKS